MKLGIWYRRALIFLVLPMALAVVYEYWPSSVAPVAAVSAGAESVEVAELRLARLRQLAATVPGKEDILKKVSADLALREAGLLRADTGAQAQAQLIQILRRLATEEAVEMRSTDLAALRPLGDAYGTAGVTIQIDCHIEQLVNFLTAIAAQTELISTEDIQIAPANVSSSQIPDKTIRVRMTVNAVVPRQLLPERLQQKDKAGKAGGPL